MIFIYLVLLLILFEVFSNIYNQQGCIFSALGGGIYMTAMRLHSSSDEELKMESFLLLFGISIFPMGGFFFCFFFLLYQLYRMISSLKISIETFGVNQ